MYGVVFEETFAPVARLTSLGIVLAISAKLRFYMHANLEEEVYISIHGCTSL